jgi:hypothetical protein
MYVIYPGSL